MRKISSALRALWLADRGPWPARRFATTSAPPPASQDDDSHVRIVEVSPRDGLQNVKSPVSLDTKLSLIKKLVAAGLGAIEAASFVSPSWVPQMANSDAVLDYCLRRNTTGRPPQIKFSFLAPNMKGFEQAMEVVDRHNSAFGLRKPSADPASSPSSSNVEVAVFAAATEAFSAKNLNCPIEESMVNLGEVVGAAKKRGLRVRGYLSVVLGCPFEGPDVSPGKVAELASTMLEMGADEIALGDTTGMGTAPRTLSLLRCMRTAGIPAGRISMHLHDTYGQALVNTAVALEHGIRCFDASVAGLGGCPYSPGATGNVSTENTVYFLESLGLKTGVDLDAVVDVGQWVSAKVNQPCSSAVGKAVVGARRNSSSA